MDKLIHAVLTIVALLALTMCSDTSYTMKTNFSSLNSCMNSMDSVSTGPLNIVTDKPGKVSGFLSNGELFNCEKIVSGTKGTYFEGYYFVEE